MVRTIPLFHELAQGASPSSRDIGTTHVRTTDNHVVSGGAVVNDPQSINTDGTHDNTVVSSTNNSLSRTTTPGNEPSFRNTVSRTMHNVDISNHVNSFAVTHEQQSSFPDAPPPSLISNAHVHSRPTSTRPNVPTSKGSSIITDCLNTVWKVTNPRPFQIEAINCIVTRRTRFMFLLRKTGEGKSLVITGSATMLRGVTVVMVPLIGLGSDQANKAKNLDNRVEAYHLDEFKENTFKVLRD